MPIQVNISGSRSAAILGLSPYQTPVQVWLSMMGPEFCKAHNYEYTPFEGNAATRFGTAFEDEILRHTENKYGTVIGDRQRFYEDGFMTCHVDGIMGDALIEAKTTSEFSYNMDYGDEGTDRVPIAYQLQIQHNLLLTGLSRAILPVLIFPRRQDAMESEGINPEFIDKQIWANVLAEMGYLKFYEIHSAPDLQELMLAKYQHFWEVNILGKTPPEPQAYDDIRALVREPVGTIIADERVERLMEEYKQIKSEIGGTGPLAKRAEQIKVEALKYMMDAGAVIDDESADKWILRDARGKKIGQYSKDKNGRMLFR